MVVDGHSLAYRAFFALPVENFTTKDNQHTNAIYGFLSMLVNLIKAEQPTHMAIAFDTSRHSFRTDVYPEYKATRSESPQEFKGQIPLLQDCLAAMSIPVLTKEGVEADDILATLAAQGAEQGYDVLVVSGDRDTIQLVTDDVTLLYPSVQGVSQLKRYDPVTVQERYGVRPEQYPDIAALVGETSDNLPGVPKVGEKTAVKWLTQFGSLDDLLERSDEIKGVVGGNLRDHIEDVRRNRRLNRLLRDVELPVAPDDLAVTPIDAQAVRDIFARLEFRTLLPRVFEAVGAGEVADDPTTTVVLPEPTEVTAADFVSWAGAQTDDVAVRIVVQGGAPTRLGAASGDELRELDWNDEVVEVLRPWLESASPKVLHDAKPQVNCLLYTSDAADE